ncbi:MAG: tripartite tricarboxylate transporter substrate binding protein [Burkholderiales bacterium]
MTRTWRALCASIVMGIAAITSAQDYPAKPIRLVVPQPAGGPTDIVARLVAQKLSERLGQQVVVDNRPGAGSNIGTELVAKAPKDGYTLVVATVQHIVNPFLFPSLPFDPVKDFTPVTLMTKAYIVLDVNPEVPVQNVKELIAYAKSKPGGIAWASAGNGSTSHLALELFKVETGVPATHVPYKGTPPALNDLIGGRVQAMFDGVVTSLPQIKAGKVKPLAVASNTRSPLLPEVPTMAEAGVPGFETVGLAAILAPAGTPPAIVDKLHREIAAILRMPEVKNQLEQMGLEVVASSPSEFAAYIDGESRKWGKLIKDAKVTID